MKPDFEFLILPPAGNHGSIHRQKTGFLRAADFLFEPDCPVFSAFPCFQFADISSLQRNARRLLQDSVCRQICESGLVSIGLHHVRKNFLLNVRVIAEPGRICCRRRKDQRKQES